MKLIITAGGTTERIDDVRSITNTSTGRLGNTIGRTILKNYGKNIETLYYLHGIRAEPPVGENVISIPIQGVKELEEKLRNLLETEEIGGVIHSMAVSDYTVKEVTTTQALKEGKALDSSKKISSEIEDLVIVMEKTPKVIQFIKKWNPKTILVGFKLLSDVPREELIDVGHNLLLKNKCTFVLANDLKEIHATGHAGYLIHEDKTYDSMATREEIAEKISMRLFEELDKGKGRK